jgi:hypothetical protein
MSPQQFLRLRQSSDDFLMSFGNQDPVRMPKPGHLANAVTGIEQCKRLRIDLR